MQQRISNLNLASTLLHEINVCLMWIWCQTYYLYMILWKYEVEQSAMLIATSSHKKLLLTLTEKPPQITR